MKILVAIANFGTSNDNFLATLLRTYREMSHDVHVVVLTDKPKDLGPDVEVVAGLPYPNPRALPFAHKQIFADRIEAYDLFIYSEDDTPVSEQNIDAYLRVTQVLPENEIAGFFRTEADAQGNVFFSTVHSHFHWVPGSVRQRGGYTFAVFTNDHSACYLLTRGQLRRAIASGGFLVEPHDGKYSLMVSAATDPYTQCGFQKVICISHLDDFITPHLPNKYLGRLGLSKRALERELHRLIEVQGQPSLYRILFEVETKVRYCQWAKNYYEHPRPELVDAVPQAARSVLSVGCGSGATEKELIKQGKKVTGVPLDAVVAVTAEDEGVEIVHGSLEGARKALEGRRYDCLLLSNVLQVVPDPQSLLTMYGALVADRGWVVVRSPNFRFARIAWKCLMGHPDYKDLGDFSKMGVHPINRKDISRWLAQAGFRATECRWVVSRKYRDQSRWLGGFFDEILSEEMVIVGQRKL